MKILITGCAGFIGFHTTKKLLKKGHEIIGIDNLNNYYDVKLKKDRLDILKDFKNFIFKKIDITNSKKLDNIFQTNKILVVLHLAAQAGVRYSIENPSTYINNNINGFFNIIDLSRIYKIKKFIYASSSSVYGNNKNFPLKESMITDSPLSLYAASKKSNELIAYSYSNIFKLNTIGLRFFTVYGPYGRPDMFLFKLVKSIYEKKYLTIFNKGDHFRDFTYIDDVTEAIKSIIVSKNSLKENHLILNIGYGKSISLKNFISYTEKIIGKKLKKKFIKIQKGDVKKTHSDVSLLQEKFKYKAKINYEVGIKEFIHWFISYYQMK